MVARRQQKQVKQVRVSIHGAILSYTEAMEKILGELKQPMYQSKQNQESRIDELEKIIKELHYNTRISIANGSLKNDSTGVLDNTMIYVTSEEFKKTHPHWQYVHALNAKIIKEYEMTTNTNPAVIDVTPVETPSVAAPASTPAPEVNPVAAAVAEVSGTPITATEPVIPPATIENINDLFHVPYMESIDNTLTALNETLDDEEARPLKVVLQNTIREWLAAFYKSLHDIDNPNRVTVDKVGLLEGTTKYSSAQYTTKYDYAVLVDQLINKFNKKYKENDGKESSVHAMATALSGAQDNTKDKFTVPTGDGNSVEVDKTTKEVTHKKDGVLVRTWKNVYKGVKHYFSAIWKNMCKFGRWIKSWFTGKEEERKDVSSEDIEKMRLEAKQRAEQLAANPQPSA